MTDIRILDALTFCVLLLIILSAFLYAPFLKRVSLNIVTLLTILFLGSYSEKLITVWEVKKFKQFISSAIESLILITISYFLITWSIIQNIILEYSLGIILTSIIIIVLLAKWQGLKIKEYIRFREVIKHVELSEKK